MSRRPQPMFLARETFRRRRLMDAARLLPFAGLFLALLPVLWPAAAGEAPATATEAVYLFAVWLGLIAAAALLARGLDALTRDTKGEDGGEGP